MDAYELRFSCLEMAERILLNRGNTIDPEKLLEIAQELNLFMSGNTHKKFKPKQILPDNENSKSSSSKSVIDDNFYPASNSSLTKFQEYKDSFQTFYFKEITAPWIIAPDSYTDWTLGQPFETNYTKLFQSMDEKSLYFSMKRQKGSTSILVAYALWKMIFFNSRVVMLSPNLNQVCSLINRLLELYKRLDPELAPPLRTHNKSMVDFGRSRFECLVPACNIRGMRIDLLLADNISNMDSKDFLELFGNIRPSMSANGQIIFADSFDERSNNVINQENFLEKRRFKILDLTNKDNSNV